MELVGVDGSPKRIEHFKALGARLRNWGRWGEGDRRGTLNFITPDTIVRAARLITRGLVIPLGSPIGNVGRGALGSRSALHLMTMMPGDARLTDEVGFADDLIILPLHCGSHWDGLAHCFYDTALYNAVETSSITAIGGATALGIHHVAGRLVGRGVLLDIAALKAVTCLPAGFTIEAEDLDAAAASEGVQIASGDIVLVRTGMSQKLESAARDGRSSSMPPPAEGRLRLPPEPGLGQSCCAWLYDHEVAAVASDNYAVEVIPPEDPDVSLPVHSVLIRDMGMFVGELFDLDALARACQDHGTWEFFFSAPPLLVTNGLGSPINPVAIL